MQEVREQVAFEYGGNYVDCILYSEGKPYVIVEFKPLDYGPLHSKVEDINKLLDISKSLKAKYAVITRFVETIIYDAKNGKEVEYFVPREYVDRFNDLWKILSNPLHKC